jgi:hypothetical protein
VDAFSSEKALVAPRRSRKRISASWTWPAFKTNLRYLDRQRPNDGKNEARIVRAKHHFDKPGEQTDDGKVAKEDPDEQLSRLSVVLPLLPIILVVAV